MRYFCVRILLLALLFIFNLRFVSFIFLCISFRANAVKECLHSTSTTNVQKAPSAAQRIAHNVWMNVCVCVSVCVYVCTNKIKFTNGNCTTRDHFDYVCSMHPHTKNILLIASLNIVYDTMYIQMEKLCNYNVRNEYFGHISITRLCNVHVPLDACLLGWNAICAIRRYNYLTSLNKTACKISRVFHTECH